MVEQFRTEGGPAVREYCPHLTKLDCCRRARPHSHVRSTSMPVQEAGQHCCTQLITCLLSALRLCMRWKRGRFALAQQPRPVGADYLSGNLEGCWETRRSRRLASTHALARAGRTWRRLHAGACTSGAWCSPGRTSPWATAHTWTRAVT